MPKKLNFKSIDEFDNTHLFEQYCTDNYIKWSKSNKINCSLCGKGGEQHKMIYRLGYCANSVCNQKQLCLVRYKALFCRYSKFHLYRLNEHEQHIYLEKPFKTYGINKKVKELIDNFVYDHHITKPKKIHIMLNRKEYQIDNIPSLQQVQHYINYKRKHLGDINDIDLLKQYILQREFDESSVDSQLFTFGCLLGNGTDTDHFQMGFTSIKLLSRIKEGVMYHLDATYKIIKYFYPLIVFGASDINRKFFPICFMLSSHETTIDYVNFFRSLQALSKRVLNYEFNPKYIITDAAKSMNKAIKIAFKNNCVNLMCWFHLKYNIRKKIHMIPKELIKTVYSDINKLHYTQCHGNFVLLWRKVKANWSKEKRLNAFHHYFEKQWIIGQFRNWQIFRKPFGYALTNSPIEQYNNNIKMNFTERIKWHMIPAMQKFEQLIEYESRCYPIMEISKYVNKNIAKEARRIIILLRLDDYSQNYTYDQINGSTCHINTLDKTCSCAKFTDNAICKHLVAVCIKERIELNGLKIKRAFSIRRLQRKDGNNESTSPISIRGRPPLVSKALELDEPNKNTVMKQKKNNKVIEADSDVENAIAVNSLVIEELPLILNQQNEPCRKKKGRPLGSTNKSKQTDLPKEINIENVYNLRKRA
jgi:hypothetical protein